MAVMVQPGSADRVETGDLKIPATDRAQSPDLEVTLFTDDPA
jgi:hypothetical protein